MRENGESYTKKFVALPNASEHQTGLAIDLALNQENIDFICPSFLSMGICEQFRQIASNYGFIERYQDTKKEITKIAKEEWHFRYVGFPHSKLMLQMNLCLEEYIEYIKKYTYPDHPLISGEYEIFYFPDKIDLELEEQKVYDISGNNVDGFIVTMHSRFDH